MLSVYLFLRDLIFECAYLFRLWAFLTEDYGYILVQDGDILVVCSF